LGGGWGVTAEQSASSTNQPDQGTVNSMRIRSGFLGNQLGLGVRGQATPWTTVTGYIQIWAWVESNGRIKNNFNYADVRQGYAKLEGLWGSLLAGRTRTLFSRGATDIDVLYAHRWGVGFPGNSIDSYGPTQGQVGFGILGSWFASGVVYGTPALGMKNGPTAQLNIGVFDPAVIVGAWTRTRWPRAEAELTLECPFFSSGNKIGKVVAFASALYEKLYERNTPDWQANTSAKGIAYGGRLELGPARLGVSGHYGRGLGLYNTLESSAAAVTQQNELRWIDGYSVLAMVVLGKVDVSAGWGITRVFLTAGDKVLVPGTNYPSFDLLKYQQGFSAGAVYHVKPWLHIDVDLFRASFAWFLGDKQVDYFANSGMMFTW
jgi:hypothetical protein